MTHCLSKVVCRAHATYFIDTNLTLCRSQWPLGLRSRSAAAHLLRLWVRIPLRAWIFVCCECCVLSGRGLCDELISRPEESYRMWCVVVCDLETSWMRRPWPALGRSATAKKKRERESYAIFRCNLDYDAACKGLRTAIPNIETSMNFGSQLLLSLMIILVLETEIKTYKMIIKYSPYSNKGNFPWRFCMCLILCASWICVND